MPFDIADFAMVVAHEMAHTRGHQHRAMRGARRWEDKEVWAFTRSMPMRLAQKPQRDPEAERAKKLAYAQGMLAKALTRQKRANTIVKKWERKVRALEMRYGDRLAAGRSDK